jgi:hypothetical protein
LPWPLRMFFPLSALNSKLKFLIAQCQDYKPQIQELLASLEDRVQNMTTYWKGLCTRLSSTA